MKEARETDETSSENFFLLGMCLLSVLISIPATEPALAFPPLPSSFYGTVKVDGVNVPDGTRVQAVITGVPYAEAATRDLPGRVGLFAGYQGR